MPDIYIDDVIGLGFLEDGVTAKGIRSQLADLKGKPLDVYINSPGGDVFEGVAIKTLLDRHDAEVNVFVDGLCASAATFPAMAGKTVRMAAGTKFMIHDPWTITIGNKVDHAKRVDLLEQTSANIAEMYATRTGKEIKEIREAMAAETWLTPAEAVEFGFADEVIDVQAKVYSIPSEFGYKNAPKINQKERPITVAAMQRAIDLTRAGLSA